MTTPARPSKTPRPAAAATPEEQQRDRRALWIGLGIAGVVLIAGITALVAGGGGGGGTNDLAVQQQPVEVTGTALPAFDSTVATADPAVGMAAPRVDGKSFFGTNLSIKPGKATMVVFLAHWCPHCQAEAPRLVQWHHAGQAPTEEQLQVLSVATGTDASRPNYPPSEWLVREEWPWPVIADDAASSAMQAFGFTNFPAFVIIDKDGVVKFRGTGEIAIADLEATLQRTLGI